MECTIDKHEIKATCSKSMSFFISIRGQCSISLGSGSESTRWNVGSGGGLSALGGVRQNLGSVSRVVSVTILDTREVK